MNYVWILLRSVAQRWDGMPFAPWRGHCARPRLEPGCVLLCCSCNALYRCGLEEDEREDQQPREAQALEHGESRHLGPHATSEQSLAWERCTATSRQPLAWEVGAIANKMDSENELPMEQLLPKLREAWSSDGHGHDTPEVAYSRSISRKPPVSAPALLEPPLIMDAMADIETIEHLASPAHLEECLRQLREHLSSGELQELDTLLNFE